MQYLRKSATGIVLVVATVAVWIWSAPTTPCAPELFTTPRPMVVTAFEPERAAVLERVIDTETCTQDNVVYYFAQLENKPIVIIESGIGGDSARATMERALRDMRVSLLVVSGVAGSVDTQLELHDVVVPHVWRERVSGNEVAVSDELLARARENTSVRVGGVGVSSDVFVTDTSILPADATIVDMETYAIGTAAAAHGIPWIAVRAVSDKADGTRSEDGYKRAALAGANAALRLVGSSSPTWPESGPN